MTFDKGNEKKKKKTNRVVADGPSKVPDEEALVVPHVAVGLQLRLPGMLENSKKPIAQMFIKLVQG